MSSKIKNITRRLVQGKTLAEVSVSAARAAASKTTTERPLTTDVDIHPPQKYKEENNLTKEQITLNVPRKQIWETIQHRNSSEKKILDWERDRHLLEAYQKEMDETEGFDELRSYSALAQLGCGGGMVSQIGSKDELADSFTGPVKSAIELYNKKMGAKFKFVEMEKGNWKPPLTFLITFTAAEENDEPIVFQAALQGSFSRKTDYTVTLCRQKANRLEGYKTDGYFMDWAYKSIQPSSQ